MKYLSAFLCALFFAVAASAATLVNINTADLVTLETLSGIGASKGQAIIDYRTQHGSFAKISDIMNVSGIGTATYNNIKDSITVGDTPTTQQTTQTDAATTTSGTTSATTSTSQLAVSEPTPWYVPPPQPDLFVDGGSDRVVIVGADSEFDARAYNAKQVLLDKARYLWNFGDGSTGEGPAVMHHYDYPGRYAVVLTAVADKVSMEDEVVVTAEAARLTFAVNADNSVSIQNGAGRDLDLSGWIVRSGTQAFTLPAHSNILSGETLRISQKTLHFIATNATELAYPNGVTALHADESSIGTTPPAPSIASPIIHSSPPKTLVPIVQVQAAAAAESAPEASVDATSAALTAAAAGAAPSSASYWWLGLIAVLVLAGGGIYAVRYFAADEWDIEEA